MRASMMVLGAAGIMAAMTLPASAMQDTMMVEKGMTMMVMPDGKMAQIKTMDEKTTAMMMEKAKPMDKAMMVMMGADGKMYVVEDTAMPDGKMLSDSMMMMAK